MQLVTMFEYVKKAAIGVVKYAKYPTKTGKQTK